LQRAKSKLRASPTFQLRASVEEYLDTLEAVVDRLEERVKGYAETVDALVRLVGELDESDKLINGTVIAIVKRLQIVEQEQGG